MFEYSQQALSVRPIFYAHRNDITFIVEDFGKENFYTAVLSTLLGGLIRVDRVIGVGGKRQVIARWRQRLGTAGNPPEFYLVDGDFDELLGVALPFSDYLYRLPRYDIESYLIEESAICTIAEEECPRVYQSDYRSILRFAHWIEDITVKTIRLVACAALLQELEETNAGLSQSIERYMTGNRFLPDIDGIEQHIKIVTTQQTSLSPEEFEENLLLMIQRMGETQRERLRWLSGKDILIPLVMRFLRANGSRSLNKDSLCFRLAKLCEFGDLLELRIRVIDIAGG